MVSVIMQKFQLQFDQHDLLLDVKRYGREERHLIECDLIFAVEKTHGEIVLVQQDIDDALTVQNEVDSIPRGRIQFHVVQ